METGVNAVTAGGAKAGWVSGDIASLALSATVDCIFDLGPDFDQYVTVSVKIAPIGPSSGTTACTVSSSDSVAANLNRRLRDPATAAGTMINAAVTVASGVGEFYARPHGRFLHVSITNADGVNALGATSKVSVSAYVA